MSRECGGLRLIPMHWRNGIMFEASLPKKKQQLPALVYGFHNFYMSRLSLSLFT